MRRFVSEMLGALLALTLAVHVVAPAGLVGADDSTICGAPPDRAPGAPHCPDCLPPALAAPPACAAPAPARIALAVLPAAAPYSAPRSRPAGPAAIRAPPPSPA